MKLLAVFWVAVVVVCVIIAKVTGLHDEDTSVRAVVDAGRTIPAAQLAKRALGDRDEYKYRLVTVSGSSNQIQRASSFSQVVVQDGGTAVFCTVAKDYASPDGPSEHIVVEGVITFERRRDILAEKDVDVIVLRDCKVTDRR